MSVVLNVEPQWISPYVFACFVTLKEKGIAFETSELDASKAQTREGGYLAQTITGRVPSLVHDGFAIAESSAIIEYLDEAFPAPHVMPRDVRERARCRQLMSWMRSDETAPIRAERPTSTMFFARAERPLSADAAAAAKKLGDVASRLVRPGRDHIFDAWCIADSELAFLLHRLVRNGDPLPEPVRAWAAAQWKRPSVRAFVERERRSA
ncbi:MAG TPA: glutathione transferase [Labilithrix sp.]|jgi:glutathione S-transferase